MARVGLVRELGRAVITGGSGLIGRALCRRLATPVVLSRRDSIPGLAANVEVRRWDPQGESAPAAALTGARTVFHLAGEAVGEGRWSASKKERILSSRIAGTRNLVAGLASLDERPEVLISASAVGYYGDRGSELLDETSEAGQGFLVDVCEAWEREALAARDLGMRVVCLRIGIVLTPDGGALGRMLLPFKMGVGGRLASGRQWMPWIHLEDVIGLLLHAARHEDVEGVMNAVAPSPVRNMEFTKTLGRVLGRPTVMPVPQAALRTLFGEMSSIMVASQRVNPLVAERTGYAFAHPELEAAMADLLGAERRAEA